MTNTLHEAIAAVRAGDMKSAQLIAVNIVRDNPDDPNGWYLLSQLVDSDARRAAYLGKTLALDPNHARARIEFDALPPALAADLAPAGLVELPETGPEGLVEEAPTATWDHAPATVAAAATLEAEAPPVAIAGGEVAEGAPVPEWLQPLGPKPVPPSAHLTPPTPLPGQPRPKPAPARKAAPARKKKKNSGNQALAILLGLLALLTVLVLAVLVYLLVV